MYLDPPMQGCLSRNLKMLRPERDQYDWAVGLLLSMSPPTMIRFIIACKNLIKADGICRPSETKCFDTIQLELTGTSRY